MMRITAICLALLVSSEAYSQNPPSSDGKTSQEPKNNSQSSKQHPTKDLRGTEKSPFVVKTLPTEKTEAQTRQEENYKAEHANNERWTMQATVILAIVTAILAFFTYRLWRATKRLVEDSQDTAQRQLRAYLSAQPNYVFTFNPSILTEIKFSVFNHGQTPALQVQSAGLIDIFPYPLPPNHPFPNIPVSAKSRSVIHPSSGMDTHVFAVRLFAANEIAQAVAGTQFRIYIFGRVNYIDAFGTNRETKFCSSVVGDQNLGAVAGGVSIPTVEIKFEPDEQHNEAT